MPARVALATCAALADLDPDDRLLLAALPEAEPVVWDDPAADWEAHDLVVLRSTWDYTERRQEFLGWVESLGGRVLNPPGVVAWNTDKRYLADLRAEGVPVVPTAFVAPGDAAPAPAVPCVVKPAVSAGSRDTARHEDPAEAAAHVERLTAAGRHAMVQPYLDEVDEAGETALVYFDGELSHAIRKGPLLLGGAAAVDGLFAPEDIEPREAREAELAVGARVVEAVARRFGGPLLYARVDLIGADPVVLEVELTEPSLFFACGVGAAERFAAAVRRRLRAPR